VRQVDTANAASLLAAQHESDSGNSGERTRLACWFESLAVASRPLQRRRAETIFRSSSAHKEQKSAQNEVRDREDALASTRNACAPQTRNRYVDSCAAGVRAIKAMFRAG
jgi:hypothetical protein